MKALLVSDLHLRPAHIEVAKKVLEKIKSVLKETNPEYLIIGGDTFHTKNIVYVSVLTLFEEFLTEVTKSHKVICLVGNHDWGIPYESHSLQTLKMKNLKIVESYYRLNDSVGFIGYCREKSRFEEFMKSLDGCSILFGHLDLNGFELGSGWEETDSFCGAERFTSFKKVFSGHFHKAQSKSLDSGAEVVYVGSGYTTDFSESDQEKRFLLIDLATGEYESILTGLTLHKTLSISAGDLLPELDQDLINSGTNYRLIVSGSKDQINNVKIPSGYKAKIVFEIQTADSTRANINSYDSHDKIMEKYVDFELRKDDNDKSLERDRLLKVGAAILSRAGVLIK